MKLAISTIVTGIVLFLLGGLFYGLLFADFFNEGYGDLMRKNPVLWAIGVGNLLMAYLLSLIYSKYFIKRGSPIGDGLAFGFLAGFLLAGPYVFIMWGSMRVGWQTIVLDAAIFGFMIVIAGMLIGLIYGRSVAASNTATTTSA